MNPSILDTDMLMPLFKGVPQIVEQARRHRDLYGHLNITIITYYEVMKGHEYVGAHDRQKVFDEFCRLNNVIRLSQAACRTPPRYTLICGVRATSSPMQTS